jgi:hypothetical protein
MPSARSASLASPMRHQPDRRKDTRADSSQDARVLPRSPTKPSSIGARFWGQVPGMSGHLRDLQRRGAASEETRRIAGKACYQAPFGAAMVRRGGRRFESVRGLRVSAWLGPAFVVSAYGGRKLRCPRSVHQRPPWTLVRAEFVEQANCVLAPVAGAMAVVAVDHRQARTEGGGIHREYREFFPGQRRPDRLPVPPAGIRRFREPIARGVSAR